MELKIKQIPKAKILIDLLSFIAFAYDMSDQPVAVTGTANGIGSANGTYVYDGNLKRVKSIINGKTIYNIYNAAGRLVTIDKANAREKIDYISGPMGSLARIKRHKVNGDWVNETTYLHPDHLGSAQAGTKEDGTIAWREQYTPFGEELQSREENNDLAGFTGHIKDRATGLNYMQARYYDPVIGRFLSVDPVGFMETGNPGMFNRYSYVSNNPINLIDPSGMVERDVTRTWKREGSSGSATITVEAGNLSQEETEGFLSDIPTAVFEKIGNKDISSNAATTYLDDNKDRIRPSSNKFLDRLNIANQFAFEITSEYSEIPAIYNISYDKTDGAYGRALTFGRNDVDPIIGFGNKSYNVSAVSLIGTRIHESIHYSGLSGSPQDHAKVYRKTNAIMWVAGFVDGWNMSN